MGDRFRLDELARGANVPTTTVRLYRTRGLLPPPTSRAHGVVRRIALSRLRLIARLQQQGHSLAGIGDLVDQWEHGRDLDAVIGVEAGSTLCSATRTRSRSGPRSSPSVSRRGRDAGRDAASRQSGSWRSRTDGAVHVPDRRFVETGPVAHLGVPIAAVLDDWEALVSRTKEIAALFVGRFESIWRGPTGRPGSTRSGPASWRAPRSPAPDGAPGRRRRLRRQPRPGWPRPTRTAARGGSGAGAE